MAEFFKALTPEERRRFVELMAMRDDTGRLLQTADEVATDLIKAFVTRYGKLDDAVAERLGGQPAYGREDILLDLVRALTGPHPLPQAWLDAERHRSFDQFKPHFYRSRGTAGDGRSIGSPGVFLQRMVAQHRDGLNSYRVSDADNAALYTEAAMLTLALVLHDLQKAVCAKQALGPAWVVGRAAHPLPWQTKRQMDALAGNTDYVAALGQAVAKVTEDFVTPELKERTNADVQHSLPPGTNVAAAFADQAGGPEDSIAMLVAEATRYLDTPIDTTEDALAEHHGRLRFALPNLIADRPRIERVAQIVCTANTNVLAFGMGASRMTGDAQIDGVLAGIAKRINDYAMTVGPPPPGTPLEHLPLFEAAASTAFASNYRHWSAHQAWQDAGLLPPPGEPVSNVPAILIVAIDDGLAGVDLDALRRIYG